MPAVAVGGGAAAAAVSGGGLEGPSVRLIWRLRKQKLINGSHDGN